MNNPDCIHYDIIIQRVAEGIWCTASNMEECSDDLFDRIL